MRFQNVYAYCLICSFHSLHFQIRNHFLWKSRKGVFFYFLFNITQDSTHHRAQLTASVLRQTVKPLSRAALARLNSIFKDGVRKWLRPAPSFLLRFSCVALHSSHAILIIWHAFLFFVSHTAIELYQVVNKKVCQCTDWKQEGLSMYG